MRVFYYCFNVVALLAMLLASTESFSLGSTTSRSSIAAPVSMTKSFSLGSTTSRSSIAAPVNMKMTFGRLPSPSRMMPNLLSRWSSRGTQLKLSSDAAAAPDDDKASKRAKNAKASESIFLKLFGFSTPSPTSLIFFVVAFALGLNGDVPQSDIIFSIAFPLYLAFLNRFRFNLNKPAVDAGKTFIPLLREGRGEWYSKYVTAFGIFSLVLPGIYCFAGPKHIARAAVPYTYLALCQYINESLCRSPNMHVLPRLLVPLGFNTFRFWALYKWVKVGFTTYDTTINASLGVHVGHIVGMGLGAVNAIMSTYNFFGFLLPRVLPQYLDQTDFPDAEVEWKGQLIPVVK